MVVSNRRDTVTAFIGDAKKSLDSSLESSVFTPTRQLRESLQASPAKASSPNNVNAANNTVGGFGISFKNAFRPRRTESGSVGPLTGRFDPISSLSAATSDVSLDFDSQNETIDENPQSGVRRSVGESGLEKSATIPEEEEKEGEEDEHPIANFFRDRVQTFAHNIEVLTGRK